MSSPNGTGNLRLADLELDGVTRRVQRAGKMIELTAKEYALLEYLLSEPGRVFSRTMIMEHVWDPSFEGATNIVETYVQHLRSKIDDGFPRPLLRTVRGIGYAIADGENLTIQAPGHPTPTIDQSPVCMEPTAPAASQTLRPSPPEVPDPAPSPLRARRASRFRSALYVLGTVACLSAGAFLLWRGTASARPEVSQHEPEVATVAVASANRQEVYNQVAVEAEFRPYDEVELHAKVAGFLTNITVDIGDEVKAGQLIAELEVPELRAELSHAVAAQEKAEADYRDAHFLCSRIMAVQKEHPNLVAQQDLDTADAKDRACSASLMEAKAEVEKYRTMLEYSRIRAPFAGVITRRYADPGALTGTGSNQSQPLVRLSDNYRLRLAFPVSVRYVKEIKAGDPVEVRVDSFGGKSFMGTISRFTRQIDSQTRKMITEIEVSNPTLELVPGMYATAILKVGRHDHALTVPIQAISADRKPIVYIVDDHGEVQERTVSLGLEMPSAYEILSGLNEGDQVIISNRSQLQPGQKVLPKPVAALAQQ